MAERLKILVSAYACSPNKGSEPGMGWNFVIGLSKYHEVHVISEEKKWKAPVEHYLSENDELKENLQFHFIRKKRNKFLRKIWPPSYYWYYRKWQKKAYFLALELNDKEDFDIIHQLNMAGFREPGYLWKIKKPFVWGPIGGMEITPWKFLSVMGFYGFLHYFGRNIINLYQRRFLRRPKQAAKRKNNQLIAATPDTQKSIQNIWGVSSKVISEVGTIHNDTNTNLNVRESHSPLRIVWAGLHIPRKALNLLLDSLSNLTSLNFELHVLGDGKENDKWKNLAKKNNIESKAIWHGWVDQGKAYKVMNSGHVFCITSLHDLTATVTLEALSLGMPIICLDHCGFSSVVDDTCGIKIPLQNPSQVVHDYSKAIEKLYKDEHLRFALSEGAIERAQDFSWSGKIEKLNKIYRELI